VKRGDLFAACFLGMSMLAIFPQTSNARHSGASAVKECRATVGRPIVLACVGSKLQHVGGQRQRHIPACRADAAPAVRACVERTVPHIVAHCRETVGRPMVQACVQNRIQKQGGSPRQFVDGCRMSISWAIRACVLRTARIATPAF
jgi:hypothetical protein